MDTSSAEPLALVQHSGGPCAILASVQGFMLQRRLFQIEEDISVDSDSWRVCSDSDVHNLLVQALVQILSQASNGEGISVAYLTDKSQNALQLHSLKPGGGDKPTPVDLHQGESRDDTHTQPQSDPMDTGSNETAPPETSSPGGPDIGGSGTLHQDPPPPRPSHEMVTPPLGGDLVLSHDAMDNFLRVVSQSHYGGGVPGREDGRAPHTFTVDSICSTLQNMTEQLEKRVGGSGDQEHPVGSAQLGDNPDTTPKGKKPKLESPCVAELPSEDVNVASIIDQFHQHIGVATFSSNSDAQKCLCENICDYKGPFGVLLFLYSLILTKGIKDICDELEDVNDPLIHGVHGYGSQNLVNLLLVGRAATNVFDHDQNLGGINLRGIPRQASVGFLTLLEAFRYCEVGSFLKSPVYPIWVTGSETHLTLTFSTEYNLASPEDFVTIAKREFRRLDLEGNGFIPSNALSSLLTTLGLETDPGYVSYMISKLDPDSLGMVLLDNFLREFCPNMPGDSTPPLAFPIYHYNGLVQSSKDGKVTFAKGSAVVLPETTGLSAADTLLNCLHSKWPGLVVHWEGGVEPKIN